MDLQTVSAIVHADGVDLSAPAATATGWSAWVWGQPEGWARLFDEHRLGRPPEPTPGSHPAAAALAHLAERVGVQRALAQLDGSFAALLTNGAETVAVSSRVGTLRWWWRTDRRSGRVRLALHPDALGTLEDPTRERLQAWIAGGADAPPPWPSVARVDAGCLQRFVRGAPAQVEPWWTVQRPPEGRAGSRILWDRALDQALTLGISRATRTSGWVHLLGGDGDPLVSRAATLPDTRQEASSVRGALDSLALLPEPALSTEALPVAAALVQADPGRALALPSAARALGAGWRRRDRPAAWHRWAVRGVAQHTAGPLGALAAAREVSLALPSLHPVVLGNAARVPWRHLRGLRTTAAARLGLARHPDPWEPFFAADGQKLWAEACRLPAAQDLGVPDAPLGPWLVAVLWTDFRRRALGSGPVISVPNNRSQTTSEDA